ncbi:hypothetical protein MMC25_000553 [Agyrium rufum]|nr:hypothetical protein [Agyrium rufum]
MAAAVANGLANGHRSHLTNGQATTPFSIISNASQRRFSDIPSNIDIPVSENNIDEVVELNLEGLPDDPTELCTVLENENAAKHFWMTISLAYAKQGDISNAIEILNKGLVYLAKGPPKEKVGLYSCLCWLYLWKSRDAPRVVREGQNGDGDEPQNKDDYLKLAMGALNDASKINPSFPPLFLARGILSLLRASLQPPSKPLAPGQVEHSERDETLRQALKCFDDASRVSAGRNMMAVLGKARALFSLGRYAQALDCYQEVLSKMPHLQDPDPRVGIGCCLWQLNFFEEAKQAWQRALDLNPSSKIATILMGIYYVHESAKYSTTDPAFGPLYKKAMTTYTQKAFKLDQDLPLTCATFGNYFLLRHAWTTVESLARKSIELTDVNAVASDGWYLLARKEHYQDPPNVAKAGDFYSRADNARGGGDRGFLPAKLGMAQIQVLSDNLDGAKFSLEKIIQHSKSLEAMMLLGTLYAQDIFKSQILGLKEDKSNEIKRAVANLEAVRMSWKDSKKGLQPDSSLLICLARLYEAEQPEKSLQCLLQVEELALAEIPESDQPTDAEDEESFRAKMREMLSPQLLNNVGCFQYQAEKFDQARETLQIALTACVKTGEKDDTVDTDALVTTISYNLARTYEASNLNDEARQVYEGILERHSDYVDARTRLVYLDLYHRRDAEAGQAMLALYDLDQSNMEVRSLYGWYLSKAKRRTTNAAEDQEQRHYKHTLQHHDKHDRYALTGMGNIWLTIARDMRRDTDQEKEKRRKTYERAVEFFDKALLLDPRNAYAAHGIGIALAEDKRDFHTAVQIFQKLRDSIRDANIYINLGHIYGELKQYQRAIENYEVALTKHRANDPQILACIGRTWLLKAKQEKSVAAMKSSLEYSLRALDLAPEQIHFKFNVAFVQIQLAQLIYSLPETQRTLVDVEAAAEGLDQAIESFTGIAKAKNPPYPKHDLEQRANMGKNTMRKQLERAIQQQREYEEANAHKIEEARLIREVELKKKDDERRKREDEAAERKRKLAEERQRLAEQAREMAERKAEEEKARDEAEYTEDSETGEKIKRKKKRAMAAERSGGKRKKKGGDEDDGIVSDGEGESGTDAAPREKKKRGTRRKSADSGAGGDSADGGSSRKKRRKLARKGGERGQDKFKSSELIIDSDSEGLDGLDGVDSSSKRPGTADTGDAEDGVEKEDVVMKELGLEDSEDDQDEDDAVRSRRKKVSRRIEDDEDEDEDEEDEDEDEEDEEDEGKGGGGITGDGDGAAIGDRTGDPMAKGASEIDTQSGFVAEVQANQGLEDSD